MTAQEGLPGDVTLQMIDLKMNTAPLPSYLFAHKLLAEPEQRNEFDLRRRGEEKLAIVINMQTTGWNLLWPPLCQYCPVDSGLLGENALLFTWHIGWTYQYSPVLLYEFIFLSPRLSKSNRGKTAMHMKVIHQCTLIRPWIDIHTFSTTWTRTLNFKREKNPFKIIKIR